MNKRFKTACASGAAAVSTVLATAPVFAAADTATVSAFTDAATGVKDTVVAIAAVAVPIMIVILAFTYGKKIFKKVAG
ncbi:MAG: hypothetical protein ABFD08_02635 [Syntrophomonas sp.]